jgi:RNA polymerase sigma-70 factor (ECF subfamily)
VDDTTSLPTRRHAGHCGQDFPLESTSGPAKRSNPRVLTVTWGAVPLRLPTGARPRASFDRSLDPQEPLARNEETIREFLANDYPGLVANLRLVTDSREGAEDVVQEALVRAWIQSDKGQEIVALRAWVGVVAVNLARSRLRRLRVERRVTEMLGSQSRAAARWNQAQPGQEWAIDTRELVRRLPRRQREVVVLRYYLDLRVEEVARALGITQGTVKKALYRAREAIVRSFEDKEGATSSDVTH